jgi:AsmA protein
MKRRWKIVAGIVAIVIVAIVAVPLFVNVNTFRPMLEQQLTASLGRQVKLGNLSLSVLSGTVVANDLSVADDPQFSQTPFLTANALRIGVEMGPLIFHRSILVRSLEIDTPKIHLVAAANGLWNFSTIGQNAPSRAPNPQQQSILPDLNVKQFSLKDGYATVEALPAAGTPRVYSNVELSIQDFSFSKQFPFTLKANLPGDGTVALTGKAGPIDQHNAAKTTFDAQLTLRHFDPVAAGFLDKSAGLEVLADIDAHAISDGQAITSNGTVHTQHLQLRPDAVPAPKPIDITYAVIHNLADNTGQLQDGAIQIGKLTAHLSGGYSLAPEAMQLNMKLTGQALPIDELQAILPAAGVKLPNGSVLQGGTLTTALAITGPLQSLVISGPAELNNTRLSGFNLSSQLKGIAGMAMGKTGDVTNIQTLRANLQVAQDGVRANNIYMSLPAIGEAVGSGTVSPTSALNFQLRMKIDTSRGIGGKAVGLLSMINGTTGKTAAQAASTGVPVSITGTSSKPIITPDVKGLLKNNASALLSKPKNSGQQVIKSLGGLFGGSKSK